MARARSLVLPSGRGHGWRPDTPDHRDVAFKAKFSGGVIPDVVQLDDTAFPAVRDQGDLGSCTGHGVTGALMYRLRVRKHPVQTRLSALYAYYQGRVIEACVKEDSGCEIRDVVKAAAKIGVATESSWPYDVRKFARTPPHTADKTAASHQVVRYYRCLDIDDILHAIAAGLPVVGGFSCFSNLDDGPEPGVIPMPGPKDTLDGGHCVWFCGGNARTRVLVFQNSWSREWGANGFGSLPFEYVEKGLADDFWAVDHE
jgi:C1A family cysteine protease